MNEGNYQETNPQTGNDLQAEMYSQAEQMKKNAAEMQEKVIQGVNKAMNSAAENLDKAADRMHEASRFFRDKNADSIRDDVKGLVKKHPTQTLAGAVILGFLFGRILSR